MNCPNCNAPASPGEAFCGNCGAPLPAQPAQPSQQQPTQQMPPAQPTQQMPPAQQYQQPYPPQQPYAQQPYPQGYQQPYGQPGYPPPAPKKSKAGIIIAVLLVGAIFVAGLGVGAYFLFFKKKADTPTTTTTTTSTVTPDDDNGTAWTGYDTPEEAIQNFYGSDIDGWVIEMMEGGEDSREYWIGPPYSEYVYGVIVQLNDGGLWEVVDDFDLSEGGELGDLTPEDEAIGVLSAHLYAIMNDQPDEAQSYTIEPFRNDPASAMYSNGEFYSFEIVYETIEAEADGTFWIQTVQEWAYGTDIMTYHLVPTELGYYIEDAYLE